MTDENEKGGPIDAVVIYRTQYENQACRVLGWLYADNLYRDRSGFYYAEGEYQIVIKGDMELSTLHELGRMADTIANVDTKILPLATFRQFDSI